MVAFLLLAFEAAGRSSPAARFDVSGSGLATNGFATI
jgi:hypothetical protein